MLFRSDDAAAALKSQPSQALEQPQAPRPAAAGSYGYHHRVEMLLGNRQLIVLKCEDVALDCLADVSDGLLPALTLRNASRETWALGDPKTVLARINNYLSHSYKTTRRLWPVKGQLGSCIFPLAHDYNDTCQEIM